MEAVPETPQEAFARFVRRAIDHARQQQGWTVAGIATHTGLGRSTVFRWLAGDWQDYPEFAKVRGFCAALDLPVAAAFRALGLPIGGSTGSRGLTGAHGAGSRAVHEDIEIILDRLADPRTTLAEKQDIRKTLRELARRPLRRAG